jgi:hypothetical protein
MPGIFNSSIFNDDIFNTDDTPVTPSNTVRNYDVFLHGNAADIFLNKIDHEVFLER